MQNEIKNIIVNFRKIKSREPTNSEIMDELEKDVSHEIINVAKRNMSSQLNDENV